MKKFRSFKLIDFLRTVSLFDAVLLLVLIILPTVVFAKGKPIQGEKGGGSTKESSSVAISSIVPESGAIGSELTVTGSGFGENNYIEVKGKVLVEGIPSNDGTTLSFTLPENTPCNPPSACPIKVIVGNEKGKSNAFPFKVTHDLVSENLYIRNYVLPDGQVKVGYFATLFGDGGSSPYTWTLIEGTLPLGLSLDSNSGEITGIPQTSGTSSFTIQLADATGGRTTRNFTIIVSQPNSTLDTITIKGRFVDALTKEPVMGVGFTPLSAPDAVIQESNADGNFAITTRVDDLTTDISSFTKSFSYSPACYLRERLTIFRKNDSSLELSSPEYDLQAAPDIFPITSEVVDIGDLNLWPATGVSMSFDREMKPAVNLPEDSGGFGNVNYMMNTSGFLGGYGIPYEYPIHIVLEDREGTKFEYEDYYHPTTTGCDQNLFVTFKDGQFEFSTLDKNSLIP